ncbi:26S proteasome non-ATPase regulatory subunit 9 [Sabethes cyaneus]|uniref:26S proteasome non-ATPase regulatory subunit 9 n=1 Tax=Sabethes cyaneus TaxID=53552 RepID=UPI00237EBB37|nr:26S proteasome non-ATPase regulatory subunit 9 [Sabethes cyaneus]
MVVPSTTSRDAVLELIKQKDSIEAKINDQGKILQANRVGMDDPLVDGDGYPRNDIDVHQVRQARHQIICLQNDLKALMKQIEHGLHTVHGETAAQRQEHPGSTKLQSIPPLEAENGAGGSRQVAATRPVKPIAKVNVVSEGSPAQEAGIALRDEIIEFGTVNAGNFRDLGQIAVVVRNCENKTVPVRVRRDGGKLVDLVLTPKSWSGRGLLGCNIVPME